MISAPGAGDTVGSAVTEGDGSALTAELGVTAVEGSSVGILEDTPSAEARGVAVGSIATGEEEGVSDIGTDADGSPDVADSEVADGEGAGGGVDGPSEVGATLLEVSETETGGTLAVDEVVSVVTGLEAASVTDVESTVVASVAMNQLRYMHECLRVTVSQLTSRSRGCNSLLSGRNLFLRSRRRLNLGICSINTRHTGVDICRQGRVLRNN